MAWNRGCFRAVLKDYL
uniref:Uncharacterized protein n=1 Tax=Anguilla anguilla TaxID=7936 RepID=A0A0E9V1I1_ANGAN